MPWSAKPSGPYSLQSGEARGNMEEMFAIFNNWGYRQEASCGMFGNVFAESGLNPWRWQSDHVNENAGYGLFQFTPASSYLEGAASLPQFSPHRSVTEVPPGATPEDGACQCFVINNDTLNKWVSSCWRSYWDKNKYASEWALAQQILEKYGSGGRLSLREFSGMDSLYEATFAFLACYEGPAVPNFQTRYAYAAEIYEYLTGIKPPEPPAPGKKKGMPLWMYLKKF